MTQAYKDKFEVGKWYKDRDEDFFKFKGFDNNFVDFTGSVRDDRYSSMNGSWNIHTLPKCTPMTIEEMKQYLPEEEWWVEPSNDLFPIY